MSKKPYTPKPSAGIEVATCAGCKHWRDRQPPADGYPADPARMGLCVATPADVVSAATEFGPLCVYRVTRANYPACGMAEPK